MGRYLLALMLLLSLLACAPHRVTVVTDNEQYGIIYDSRYFFPVTYKSKYVDIRGVDNRHCELQTHTIDNLYYPIPANVHRCVDYFDGYGPKFFEVKDRK